MKRLFSLVVACTALSPLLLTGLAHAKPNQSLIFFCSQDKDLFATDPGRVLGWREAIGSTEALQDQIEALCLSPQTYTTCTARYKANFNHVIVVYALSNCLVEP